MKKIVFIHLLLCLSNFIKAQSNLFTTKGITFPSYISSSRPAANSIGIGSVLYNSSENVHQYSNGSSWLNLRGENTLPTGAAYQTLWNNGSGWVSSDFFRNIGFQLLIGTNSPFNGIVNIGSVGSMYALDINNLLGIQINTTQHAISASSNSGYPTIDVNNASGTGISVVANGVAIYGSSQSSYGGNFYGRLIVRKGGNGDAGIEFRNNFSNLHEGYIGMNGDNEMGIWGYGLGNWIQRWNINTGTICYATNPTICSDIRLKKDFKILENSASRLYHLNGYHYLWNNEKMAGLQTGFIAQEIQKIFPELVEKDINGYLSVNYIGLIPHLVEANKTLQKQNNQLLIRLERLEAIIEAKNIFK